MWWRGERGGGYGGTVVFVVVEIAMSLPCRKKEGRVRGGRDVCVLCSSVCLNSMIQEHFLTLLLLLRMFYIWYWRSGVDLYNIVHLAYIFTYLIPGIVYGMSTKGQQSSYSGGRGIR